MMRPIAIAAWLGWLLASCHAQTEDSWTQLPLESRASLKIESQVGDSETWKAGEALAKQGEAIRLRVKQPSDAASIRWFQIVPDTSRYYKNANHPWEPEAYKWVGFGEIEYQRRELTEFRDQWQVELSPNKAFAKASRSSFYRADLGSFWLQVEVQAGEKRLRSAGLEENDQRNLTPQVFRVSVRKDDGYLGHLTTFFNVPGLFGSIPYQSNHYIGVDCADVLVAARRKWLGLNDARDYNVAMLVSEWKRVASFEMERGVPGEEVTWGEQVEEGDVIAVRYAPGKAFQHIGALYGDTNGDGKLNAADEVLHAGPQALHLTPLRRGSFDGEVVVLRPPR